MSVNGIYIPENFGDYLGSKWVEINDAILKSYKQ